MGEANDISCLIKLSQRFINEGQKDNDGGGLLKDNFLI